MRSCLFYTECVLRSPRGTSNITEPARAPPALQKRHVLSQSVTFALARVFLRWCSKCQEAVGTSLSVAFYAATLASPLPLKVHMHQSPGPVHVPTMSKPLWDACICREMAEISSRWRGLCWLRHDCNRISLNLYSALPIVLGFCQFATVSLSLSLCETLLAWSCLNMTHILNGGGELYLFNCLFA